MSEYPPSLETVAGYLYITSAVGMFLLGVAFDLANIFILKMFDWTLMEYVAIHVSVQICFAVAFFIGYKMLGTAVSSTR